MNRRTLLTCGGAAIALIGALPGRAVALNAALLDEEARLAPLRDLAGTRVRASGFALPHIGDQDGFFVLSRSPLSTCPHCRVGAGGAMSELFVFPKSKVQFGNGVWEGRLDIGGIIDPDSGTFSLIRLYEAERLSQ
jgi:hypothetical protein